MKFSLARIPLMLVNVQVIGIHLPIQGKGARVIGKGDAGCEREICRQDYWFIEKTVVCRFNFCIASA